MDTAKTSEVNSYRRNRLKEIFIKMGFQWNDRGQPISKTKLFDLGITKNRMKDLIENREGKPHLLPFEASSIAQWLGVKPINLYEDDIATIEQLNINIDINEMLYEI